MERRPGFPAHPVEQREDQRGAGGQGDEGGAVCAQRAGGPAPGTRTIAIGCQDVADSDMFLTGLGTGCAADRQEGVKKRWWGVAIAYWALPDSDRWGLYFSGAVEWRPRSVVCQRGECTVREESARYDAGRTPFGIDLATGAVVMVGAAFVAVLFRDVDARLVVVAIVAGGYAAAVADTRASVAVAAIGYLLFNGFLVNSLGELTWDGMSSLWHLFVFVLAIGLGLALRRVRAIRADLALSREAASLAGTRDAKEPEEKKEALRG
jgi:hypothetical protein